MSPNKTNVHYPVRIVHPHHQSVLVPADIEHHTVVPNDAGIAECGLNRRGTSPVRVGCFSKPGFKWLLGIGIFRLFPKQPQCLAGNYSHPPTHYGTIPNWEQRPCRGPSSPALRTLLSRLVCNSRTENPGNYPIDRVIKAIANTCSLIVFPQKDLDTIGIDTLYKRVRAIVLSRTVRKKTSMMTSRKYKEHLAKWQPSAAMRGVCLLGRLSSASTTLGVNRFGGRLGQKTSIDSRHIRH